MDFGNRRVGDRARARIASKSQVEEGHLDAVRGLRGRGGGPQLWSAWFRRIVTNSAVDIARKTRRAALVIAVRELDVPDVARAAESADGMRRVLDRLAPDERALIVLRYGRDLELPVVADLMGLRLGTAKSRLHRTLNKLRRMLEAES